jgi:hypothetical protein
MSAAALQFAYFDDGILYDEQYLPSERHPAL